MCKILGTKFFSILGTLHNLITNVQNTLFNTLFIRCGTRKLKNYIQNYILKMKFKKCCSLELKGFLPMVTAGVAYVTEFYVPCIRGLFGNY